jgi:hypothetical protein
MSATGGEAPRLQASEVALDPLVGGHTTVQDALGALGIVPVAGTGTTLGFYGATPVTQPVAIPDPAGGATVDSQARAAIVAILDVLGAGGGGVGITA